MALQQLSSGGATSPVAPDATSAAAQQQGQTTSTTGLTLQQYLADIAGIAPPVVSQGHGTPQDFSPTTTTTGSVTTVSQPPASPNIQIDPFTGDPSSPTSTFEFIGNLPGSDPAGRKSSDNPYSWDPFSAGGAGEFPQIQSETASQGYKDFGQPWLDLVNTIATQDLQWGGTNQYGGELKGGGSVGPWLSENILTPWNAGDKQKAHASAIDFISSQTGKPATDPETQQLGGAFLEYTLQNANRYGLNTSNFQNRRASEGGKGIFGEILPAIEAIASIIQPELAIPIGLANFGEGISQGSPLSAIGGLLGAVGGVGGIDPVDLTTLASDLGTVPSTLSDISSAANIAGAGMGLGEGLSQGNLLGAASSGIGLGADLLKLAPDTSTGTTGSNATQSGGVLSSVADSIGLTPDQLVGYLGGGVGVGTAATPLIQQAMASSPTLNVQPPLPPPPAPAVAPPGPPSAAGEPITPEQVFNPSQAGYRPPGPRQANPEAELAQLMSLLAA